MNKPDTLPPHETSHVRLYRQGSAEARRIPHYLSVAIVDPKDTSLPPGFFPADCALSLRTGWIDEDRANMGNMLGCGTAPIYLSIAQVADLNRALTSILAGLPGSPSECPDVRVYGTTARRDDEDSQTFFNPEGAGDA